MFRFLSIFFFLLCFSQAFGATWYVDNSASGANDGSSEPDAWESLGDIVWASLSAGDVVYVDEGNGLNLGTLTIGKSGTSGNLIWFIGTGSNQPKITSISNSGAYDYIGVVNFDMIGGSSAFPQSGKVDGWKVVDNNIHGYTGGLWQSDKNFSSDYNTFRGNTIQDLGTSATSGANHWSLSGKYNLVEYNKTGRGSDKSRSFGKFNIIRNNYFGPMLEADLNGTDPHIDILQGYENTENGSEWTDKNILEANFSDQNNTSNGHGIIAQDTGSRGLQGLINRFNIHYKHGSSAIEFNNFDNSRNYNNLWIDLYQQFLPLDSSKYFCTWIRGTSTDHKFLNVSFVRAVYNSASSDPFTFSNGATADRYNCHTYQSGDFSGAGSGHVENSAPGFTNEAAQDFMPTSGSPLVGAARYITLSNGSGASSTSLAVDDSDYFTDGWGIVEGDLIKIGSNAWVRIISINYSTEVITLATAQSWSDNAEVILFGTNDIGPLEYRSGGYTVTGSYSGSGNSYTATMGDNDVVRMVVWSEDGVPQAPDYDAPFQYTSNGGVVTAKAYLRYAAKEGVVVLAQEDAAGGIYDGPARLDGTGRAMMLNGTGTGKAVMD